MAYIYIAEGLTTRGDRFLEMRLKNAISGVCNLCSDDETVDLTLDEKLRTHILDNSTNIIESRLVGYGLTNLSQIV